MALKSIWFLSKIESSVRKNTQRINYPERIKKEIVGSPLMAKCLNVLIEILRDSHQWIIT